MTESSGELREVSARPDEVAAKLLYSHGKPILAVQFRLDQTPERQAKLAYAFDLDRDQVTTLFRECLEFLTVTQ